MDKSEEKLERSEQYCDGKEDAGEGWKKNDRISVFYQ